MSKPIITAKVGPDGKLVRVLENGREIPLRPRRPRSMTGREISAAAHADPDARPMTPAERRAAKRAPRVKTIRRALGLTQEEFAARYKIPLGTMRDWEQERSEPDQPARCYLFIIARDPELVYRLLHEPLRDVRVSTKVTEAANAAESARERGARLKDSGSTHRSRKPSPRARNRTKAT